MAVIDALSRIYESPTQRLREGTDRLTGTLDNMSQQKMMGEVRPDMDARALFQKAVQYGKNPAELFKNMSPVQARAEADKLRPIVEAVLQDPENAEKYLRGQSLEAVERIMALGAAMTKAKAPKQQKHVPFGLNRSGIMKEGSGEVTREPTVAEVKADKPLYQPGEFKEFKEGDKIVTKRWDGNNWVKEAEGNRFKPGGLRIKTPEGLEITQGDFEGQPIPKVKLSTDTRMNPETGEVEIIKGSKTALEIEALADKEEGKRLSTSKQARTVVDFANKALDQTNWTSTGIFGQLTGWAGGSPSAKLEARIKPIKANVAFNKLEEIKRNSPTGGALGQVSNLEIGLLYSVEGSLEAIQGPEQLKENLIIVRDSYRMIDLINSVPKDSILNTKKIPQTSKDTGDRYLTRADIASLSDHELEVVRRYYESQK